MKSKSFIIVLLFFIFTTFSVAFSAKESEKFKVVIGSDEDIRISDVRLGVSIANVTNRTNDSKQYGVSDYQYYIISGSSIKFDRPSDTFILTIDEDTLPVGYEVDENNVFIDEETNIYKFEVVRKKEISSFESENKQSFNDECRIDYIDENDPLFNPLNRSYTYVSQGRFYVYYESTLTNGSVYANSVLDYIDDIESFFGYYGFEEPRSSILNNHYHIYLKSDSDIGGVYGVTSFDLFGNSTISLNLSLFGRTSDDDAFVSTLAHEYYHASVHEMNASMCDGWFSEASATAVGLYYVSENYIESDFIKNAYNGRLHWHFINSEESIDDINNEYNNFIFIYYFIQEYGLDFVFDLVDSNLNHGIYVSNIDNALQNENTDIGEAFQSFCEYNLNPKDSYDVISFYKENWDYATLSCKPSNHNTIEINKTGYFSLEELSSFYISMKAYEGYDGCSDYEGQITLVLPDYRDISVYAATITSTGYTYYEEISIPTTYSNILGGYAIVIYTNNLGSSYCKELKYVICGYEYRDIIGSYSIQIRHHIPSVYESYSVTFGSILNDLRFLKFVPYDTGLYQFDLSTGLGSALSNEIVVKNDSFSNIYRFDNGGISLGAHNNSSANSFVCYLEEGEKYFIMVIDDSSVSSHILDINRSYSTFTPSLNNSFGVTNEYFTKSDKLYEFTVPQTGDYKFTLSLNSIIYYDMYFVVYRENAYGLSLEDYDIINTSYQTSELIVSLVQGDIIYVGYYDYRCNNSTFNLLVLKV